MIYKDLIAWEKIDAFAMETFLYFFLWGLVLKKLLDAPIIQMTSLPIYAFTFFTLCSLCLALYG